MYEELKARLRYKAGLNQYKFSDVLMIDAADAIDAAITHVKG